MKEDDYWCFGAKNVRERRSAWCIQNLWFKVSEQIKAKLSQTTTCHDRFILRLARIDTTISHLQVQRLFLEATRVSVQLVVFSKCSRCVTWNRWFCNSTEQELIIELDCHNIKICTLQETTKKEKVTSCTLNISWYIAWWIRMNALKG